MAFITARRQEEKKRKPGWPIGCSSYNAFQSKLVDLFISQTKMFREDLCIMGTEIRPSGGRAGPITLQLWRNTWDLHTPTTLLPFMHFTAVTTHINFLHHPPCYQMLALH